MGMQVRHRAVMNNLVRLRKTLETGLHKQPKGGETFLVYPAFLHRLTGNIHFVRTMTAGIGSLEDASDWQQIEIVVLHPNAREMRFDLRHLETGSLKITELAHRVAEETMDVLNYKTQEIVKQSQTWGTIKDVLKDIDSIEVVQHLDCVGSLPGWVGSVSREEAEMILKEKKCTYLIREADDVVKFCVSQLSLSNHEAMKPYLLMVIGKNQEIFERLIVYTPHGWILYLDEPRFEKYRFYGTIRALLANLEAMTCRPLIFEEKNG